MARISLPDNLTSIKSRCFALLDWLDDQSDTRFLLFLYLSRWVVIIPIALIQQLLYLLLHGGGKPPFSPPQGALAVFFLWVFIVPFVETVVECSLPYLVLARGKTRLPRPWTFIIVSALVMVVLHPLYAIPCTFVTGVFLAYCYAHFATRGHRRALAFTMLFHGAINTVGWFLIYVVGVLPQA